MLLYRSHKHYVENVSVIQVCLGDKSVYNDSMKTRIDIDTRTFVRFGLVVIGFGLVILAVYSARTALVILAIAAFLALALNRPVSRLSRLLPGRSRVAATALAYVAVMAVLASIVFLVIPPIVQQSAKFVQTFPNIADTANQQWAGVNHFIDQYDLRDQVNQAANSIKDNTSRLAANAGQAVVTSIGSVFGILTATLLVLVLTFLMLIEGPTWIKRIWSIYKDPTKLEKHQRLASRMYAVFTGYVTGQLTVSAIGAGFAGLAVFIISFVFPSVPANLAMPTAAITFIMSLIPMFGATIGGTIVTLLLAFNSVPAAITYAIYFIAYQQIENNFISPHIQSKKIDLTALAVLTSVTIGLYVFGIAGGIIAIPVAGAVRVLVEEHFGNNKQEREKRTKLIAKAESRDTPS
ncbi:MAG: conserved rane protein of unknown function [Candidatus Saccharibacteria bacterium]|nr:conserved rane protein of unknown function [Candidatus Saccharibacteria bacterium]